METIVEFELNTSVEASLTCPPFRGFVTLIGLAVSRQESFLPNVSWVPQNSNCNIEGRLRSPFNSVVSFKDSLFDLHFFYSQNQITVYGCSVTCLEESYRASNSPIDVRFMGRSFTQDRIPIELSPIKLKEPKEVEAKRIKRTRAQLVLKTAKAKHENRS